MIDLRHKITTTIQETAEIRNSEINSLEDDTILLNSGEPPRVSWRVFYL